MKNCNVNGSYLCLYIPAYCTTSDKIKNHWKQNSARQEADLFKHILFSKQLLPLAVGMRQLDVKWISASVLLARNKVYDVGQQLTCLTEHINTYLTSDHLYMSVH